MRESWRTVSFGESGRTDCQPNARLSEARPTTVRARTNRNGCAGAVPCKLRDAQPSVKVSTGSDIRQHSATTPKAFIDPALCGLISDGLRTKGARYACTFDVSCSDRPRYYPAPGLRPRSERDDDARRQRRAGADLS